MGREIGDLRYEIWGKYRGRGGCGSYSLIRYFSGGGQSVWNDNGNENVIEAAPELVEGDVGFDKLSQLFISERGGFFASFILRLIPSSNKV